VGWRPVDADAAGDPTAGRRFGLSDAVRL